ncbi:MAG: enoyl-CoA hydratase/isomerase family protein [Burkholderiales bacterium]|nr:MAG: enoyl-CoA hydratase/isomerase family protein [Burkholderiales bacterium]
MKEDITRADSDGVIVVTLNRPEKRNAMTIAMRETLFRAVDDLRDNDDLRVLLIRAEGPFFTAGIDVKEHYALYPPSRGMQEFRRDYRRNIHRFLDEMEAVEKPIVMAINGPCLGLGVEMAGAVDFRLASTDARFALPEVDMGIIAGSGGTSRIVRLCGVGWAKWLGMAGEPIDAQTALAAGLVQAVWAPAEFDEKAMDFCRRLAGKPIDAVGMAKLAIDLCRDLDRAGGRTLERIANTPLILDGNKRIADRDAEKDRS